MKSAELQRFLQTAIVAAHASGRLMRTHWHRPKKIAQAIQHDIKLELDVRCQKTIERILRRAFPALPVLGEEGVLGDPEAPLRWVVDPIDGTVNFTYGIPHACVSIALQERVGAQGAPGTDTTFAGFRTVVGVVFDPFCNELWTAVAGGKARLNGRVIRVSQRAKLAESIVSLGFAKSHATMNKMLPTFDRLAHRVRKIRIMGAAALASVYVASGRFDAYLEYGLRLWDIAAGGLILECAGGDFWWRTVPGEWTYEIAANNRMLRGSLLRLK